MLRKNSSSLRLKADMHDCVMEDKQVQFEKYLLPPLSSPQNHSAWKSLALITALMDYFDCLFEKAPCFKWNPLKLFRCWLKPLQWMYGNPCSLSSSSVSNGTVFTRFSSNPLQCLSAKYPFYLFFVTHFCCCLTFQVGLPRIEFKREKPSHWNFFVSEHMFIHF